MISVRITLGNDWSGHDLEAGRSKDWWAQAVRDLEQANYCYADGRHEWACFAAQQAAEKAIKAVLLYLGHEGKGNVVANLITDVPSLVTQIPEMLEWARVLDTYYLPTRYPDSHADGAPFERYGRLQSEEAICYASKILEGIKFQVNRLIVI